MPSIFDPTIRAISGTLKQLAIDDIMRDYAHATRIFVDSNYRLIPKQGFLFHVYFDIDPELGSLSSINRNSLTEVGLMVKSADLPKYSIDTKTYNSYNRPNIVQSKIKFDNLSISFHDDSANIIRNFWYDYYRYYYRDSDHSGNTYGIEYKYQPQTTGNFGFTRRTDTYKPYLRSVRLYSLHQKRFSEYILLNPIIKSFKHGQHQNSGDAGTMGHDMVIEYENVLYADGTTTFGNPPGFADLHYDTRSSPLVTVGGTHRVFGPGGIVDMSQSILTDINEQDYLSAIFKTARAANTARSMNLKNSAISELNGFVTEEISDFLQDSITNYMRQSSGTGYTIPTINGIDGVISNQYNGISRATSLPFLGEQGLTKSNKRVTTRAQSVTSLSNINTRLPLNPGVTPPDQNTNNGRNIINSQSDLRTQSNQGSVDAVKSDRENQRQLAIYQQRVSDISGQIYQSQQQVNNATNQISSLNARLTAAQSATPPLLPPPGFNLSEWQANKDRVIRDLNNQILLSQSLRDQVQADIARQTTDLNREQAELDRTINNRNL